MNFNSLPTEIKLSIFNFIDEKELQQKVACVTKEWNQICKTPSLRRKLEITKHHVPTTRSYYLQKYYRLNNLKLTKINDWNWTKTLRNSNYLRRLEFYGCKFNSIDEIFHVVKKFPSIRELKMMKCKCLVNVCCTSVPVCKYLRSVSVDLQFCSKKNSEFGGRWMSMFAGNCPDLQEFDVSDSICLDESSFVHLVTSQCEKLTKLSLNCSELSDKSYYVLDKCRNLTDLRLYETRNITDVGLTFLKNLSKLKVLQITHGLHLSPQGFVNLFKESKFPHLSHLSFDRCWNLSNQGLEAVAKSCPILKNLHLNACHDISDNGLLSVVRNCKYLEEITLYLDIISGDFLGQINRHLPRLIYLNLEGCWKIPASEKLFTELKSRNPRLRIIRPDGCEIETKRQSKENGCRFTTKMSSMFSSC